MTEFVDSKNAHNVFYGFFFGILAIVSLVSLGIGFLTRIRTFLHYGLYVLLLGFYIFTALGFSFQFLYPSYSGLNNYTRIVLVVFLSIASINFTLVFLNIKNFKPKIYRLYSLLRWGFMGLFIAWLLFFGFFDRHVVLILNIVYTLVLANFVLMIFSVFSTYKYHKNQALLYAFAFGNLLLAGAINLAIEYGIFGDGYFKISPFVYGAAAEVLVLTIAMLIRLNNLFKERRTLSLAFQEVSSLHGEVSKKVNILEKEIELKEKALSKLAEKETFSSGFSSSENYNKIIALKNKTILNIDDIISIEVNGRYLEYALINKENSVIDRNTLKDALHSLPSDIFFQTHKSYVINKNHIFKVTSAEIEMEKGLIVPVSRTFRDNLKEAEIFSA